VDGETIYRFAPWLVALTVMAGLAAVPVGWLLRRWSTRWGYVLIGMGPIALLLIVPGLFRDRVMVDAQHFELTTGFWWSPTQSNIRFADLDEIQFITQQRQARGGPRETYQLECIFKSGRHEFVSVGDLMQTAVGNILARAQDAGVRITGLE
jgi:hypothetical protein